MKKVVSIISALALTVGMVASFSANAADSSAPTVYFKTKETKGVEVLSSGNLYVNKKAADANGAVIPAEVYLSDKNAGAGWVCVKWACEKQGLTLQNVKDPQTKPYKSYTNDTITSEKTKSDGVKVLSALYCDANVPTDGKLKPLQLAGEKSDSYPLATFEAAVDKSAAGSYDIIIYNKNQDFTYVTYRTGDNPEYVPDSEKYKLNCKELRVNVSDRLLGDVNNDGKINAVDASEILSAYANVATSKPTGLSAEAEAAADVDGNGKINAVDASNVLSYYAYQSTSNADKSKTLNDFIV